jgi:hypothetical protein
MCGAKMGQTPRRMTGFSIICNKFPSLLSSLLRCFAALYPFGANCLTGKFAQRAVRRFRQIVSQIMSERRAPLTVRRPRYPTVAVSDNERF